MLTRDRPEMAKRAVASFRAQTYGNKLLLIYDTSTVEISDNFPEDWYEDDLIQLAESNSKNHHGSDKSIGYLRNRACACACAAHAPNVFIHWDDDDYSHPNRISEQVALLQSSGADCVGYRDMLFWRQTDRRSRLGPHANVHEAWLFTGPFQRYVLGTSLCYWRKTWERRPFLNENQGVEEKWCVDLAVASTSCFPHEQDRGQSFDPRMIASIHGGNTSTGYDLEKHVAMGSQQWKRASEWDDYCRESMSL